LITNIGEAYNLDKTFISYPKRNIIKREGLCGVCGKKCEFWVPNVFKIWGNNGIYVDTSKMVSWFKRIDHESLKYIRLTRSVYDRLGSFKRKKGYITKEIVKNWVAIEERISNYLRKKEHFVVKYEDICHKKGLHEICDFIGLPWNEKMWDFWETLHHPIRGNHFTNLLVRIHHNLVSINQLNHKEKDFINMIGFSIRYIDRTKFLNSSDLKLIEKYGGKKTNKEIGYC
jgi:hypothetical protein